MNTFRTISYAGNVLLYPNEEDYTVGIEDTPGIPVSVIRISGDESEPFVFECTSADLDRLIEAFNDARSLLSRASELAIKKKTD